MTHYLCKYPSHRLAGRFAALKKLPTGKSEKADKKYEDYIAELFSSLFYPHLDFAQVQVRTDSGVSIRDLIFYNSRTHDFLKELMDDYGARQVIMEMKNVVKVTRSHIDQLNRYLHDDLGKVRCTGYPTRNEKSRAQEADRPLVRTAQGYHHYHRHRCRADG